MSTIAAHVKAIRSKNEVARKIRDLAETVLAAEPSINDEARRDDLEQNLQDEIESWLSCELFTGEKICK